MDKQWYNDIELNYNKEILIFDNLDLSHATEELHGIVTSKGFGWYLNSQTVVNPDPYDNLVFNEYDFMTHVFILNKIKNSDSDYLPIKMLELFSEQTGIKFKQILRAQANIVFEKKTSKPSPPHVDTHDKHYVLLVYLSDSDGDTILYDNNIEEITRITPNRGRCVLFDGSIKHAVIPPINTKHRVVFNYNLEV